MDDNVLVTRVIEVLAARTGWAWDPTGVYPTGFAGPALFYGPTAPNPDAAIGVTLYDTQDAVINDGPEYGYAQRRVQLRIRGARGIPDGADLLASQAFRALHGLSRVAGLNHAERVLVAQMGVDGNNRAERADSYLIIPDTEA